MATSQHIAAKRNTPVPNAQTHIAQTNATQQPASVHRVSRLNTKPMTHNAPSTLSGKGPSSPETPRQCLPITSPTKNGHGASATAMMTEMTTAIMAMIQATRGPTEEQHQMPRARRDHIMQGEGKASNVHYSREESTDSSSRQAPTPFQSEQDPAAGPHRHLSHHQMRTPAPSNQPCRVNRTLTP